METLQFFYSPGACSLALHVALEQSGLAFEPVCKRIAQGEHLDPAYRQIHPQARVPALWVGGESLTELPALLVYVAQRAPAARLLPDEPLAQARVLGLLAWLSSTLHIAFAHLWRGERFATEPEVWKHLEQVARAQLPGLFEELDARLPPQGWVGGAQPGIGDFAVLPFARWALRLGVPIGPRLQALLAAAAELPAVQRALAREGLESLTPAPL
ncbi:glutathione S-transferase family protein [Inhella proteolytica]|uniref:Glutathione S-transferase n=1 Tax=Inhella proteolytica TaxID=2795029 RepID=A0A931J784_9BURK|nr:glutathione S-transferase C-terminal domain-containing protein [Inhella proteolytica]MBH9578097.1 glutathione S-transferase [Inhella proteolytica]